MTIPALFIGSIVGDRTNRAGDVIRDVSRSVGGPQTFLGPTLVVPYTVAPQYTGEIGAIASFAAVALAMYLTRSVNWYSSSPGQAPPEVT